jgi:hypothetical protein
MRKTKKNQHMEPCMSINNISSFGRISSLDLRYTFKLDTIIYANTTHMGITSIYEYSVEKIDLGIFDAYEPNVRHVRFSPYQEVWTEKFKINKHGYVVFGSA